MPKPTRLPKPVILVVLMAVSLAVGSFGITLTRNGADSHPFPLGPDTSLQELPEEFSKLAEVWLTLKDRHLDRDDLDDAELAVGAVRGMLEALDDPYASYLPPEIYSQEADNFSGQFSGIGAEVGYRNQRIIIFAPMPDTPAEAAGLRPGDTILSIDGESTEGISLQEAVRKIRGPEGTSVSLLILHQNGGEPVTVTIIRGDIKIRSVKFRSLVGGVGHLKISSFTQNTEREVVEAIQTFKRRNLKGLILDLRNNPGGLLTATVKVTSQFLDGGLVLYEINNKRERVNWMVQDGGKGIDIPMVVLMNEFSASGSEVLIGAIRDAGRAKTIGVRSFGKGSVNSLHELSDGSGIYFTVARWFTPGGELIEGEGIEPDIVVEIPEDAKGDPQLERAIVELKAL